MRKQFKVTPSVFTPGYFHVWVRCGSWWFSGWKHVSSHASYASAREMINHLADTPVVYFNKEGKPIGEA